MLAHVKRRMFLGFLAAIPFGLSYFAIRMLYVSIDQEIAGLLARVLGIGFPGLGFLLVLAALYFLGVLTSNLIGRQILAVVDRAASRIPLIKSTYQIGKQLADTLSLPEKQIFQRTVLVGFLKPGIWTTGFVTGSIRDRATGEVFLKVYVPTPPNPLSGTMVMAKESDLRDPGWTVEEGLKVVMSGGIIGPDEIRTPETG